MRHLFALNLYLKSGLLLRTDVECHPDCFQKISVLTLQAASTHNYPTRFAIWQKKAVLALECIMQSTSTIILGFHRNSFIRMYPRKNQVAGQWQVGVESVNPASLITHPGRTLFGI